MEPEKVKEIIEPLDNLLRNYGFKIKKEKNFDDSSRRVKLLRDDGLEITYCFKVHEANGSKYYVSTAHFELNAELFYGRDVVSTLLN
jgi:hypothetical protein